MDVLVERWRGWMCTATASLPPCACRARARAGAAASTFGTTIGQLETLADWLEGFAVTLVGMEATGVYWRPVFYALERRFECWLLNAQHLHNVPGRKSDVIDSVWCCQLVEHGLVHPSFVPPAGDPPTARPDPAAQHPDRGAHAGDPAAGEGAARHRHQALPVSPRSRTRSRRGRCWRRCSPESPTRPTRPSSPKGGCGPVKAG